MRVVAAVDARSAPFSQALPPVQVVPSISVVVPVFNEAPTVGQLFDELRTVLVELGKPWEVIFVDDGSTDTTCADLRRLSHEQDGLRVVRMRKKFGKSAALAAGFDAAHGEVIVTIDGDLQDDPAAIPQLLSKLYGGFDLVSGWKRTRQDAVSRRAASRVFNVIAGCISGVRLHDMNCGLKAYRAEVVRGLALYGELHRFIPILAHHRGFRVAEIPVDHRPRMHGRSRYGLERYVRGLLDLITVCFLGRYRYRPLHLFGSLGLILSTGAFGILSYLTALKMSGHAIGQRPLLTLGVLLAVTGLQFLSIGLIGELITTQHEERRAAPDRLALRVDEILP
jgi:glycosyltransferase involved in cell wall biosynthesis